MKDCRRPRLSIRVAKETGTVVSVDFRIVEGEAEQDLARVKTRYPSSHFKLERYLYNYGDYLETFESYTDSKTGLSIGFDGRTKKVSSITRSLMPLDSTHAPSASGYPQITKLPTERETASE
jgi:hypothetical protein